MLKDKACNEQISASDWELGNSLNDRRATAAISTQRWQAFADFTKRDVCLEIAVFWQVEETMRDGHISTDDCHLRPECHTQTDTQVWDWSVLTSDENVTDEH